MLGREKVMEDADHGASPTTLEVHDKKQWSTAAQKSMHCRVISLLIFYGHTECVTPIHTLVRRMLVSMCYPEETINKTRVSC